VDPGTCGGRGNKRADQLAALAGDAVENAIKWHAPVRPSDFLPLLACSFIYALV
jgi:hypothetical protein